MTLSPFSPSSAFPMPYIIHGGLDLVWLLKLEWLTFRTKLEMSSQTIRRKALPCGGGGIEQHPSSWRKCSSKIY